MAFDRPTLSALVKRITADFRSRLSLGGAILRRAVVVAMGAVWAGAAHLMHGHLVWAARQLFATTADREYLLAKSGMYGLSLTAATYATGNVTATGTNGITIEEDTILVHEDGATFRVTADTVISGGTALVPVEAVNAGSDGNLASGESLAFESPIAGVDATVTVAAGGISGGFEEESTEEHRARFLSFQREKPTGGSDADYKAWALEVAGVTRAWVHRHWNGLGTVKVYFMVDINEDGVEELPDGAAVTAVQTKLNAERPTTAEVTAAAPTHLSQNFTLAVTPNTSDVQAAVNAELDDLFFRKAEPGDGAGRGTVLISEIRTAIGVAAGLTNYTLTTPSADIVPTSGQLIKRGTMTYS